MQNKHDVTIVGAGPVGSYLAQLLKIEGVSPLLIEEHKEIGRPIHCAGLVGKRVFSESKIPIAPEVTLNTINGATFYLEDDSFEIRRKEVAYVIDRESFDKNLGDNLDIIFETKFLGLEKNKHGYIIETDKGDIPADIVIGADGANSGVRNIVRGHNSFPYLRGVQFRMKFEPLRKDMVDVYIKKPYFYWVIPEGQDTVRVGVISHNPYHDLLEFIKEKKMGQQILEKFAGIVPLAYLASLAYERVLLVGDSAAQVKPLTYGGIYMGMRGAELLAECISKGKLSHYSSLWVKKFGAEIKVALRAREIFNALTDKDVKRVFAFVKERTKVIEEKGDFENHSILLWEFLKNPGVSKEVLSIFFTILKANLVDRF